MSLASIWAAPTCAPPYWAGAKPLWDAPKTHPMRNPAWAAPWTASARPCATPCKNAGITLDQIGAVGIAVPGHIDVPGGMIRWAPNFGHFDDSGYVPYKIIPLRDLVSQNLGMAMVMDNDANVAALGEFSFGAGEARKHLVMFTLGTGIGGGIIVEGEVLRGATGGAAEVGPHHHCGRPGQQRQRPAWPPGNPGRTRRHHRARHAENGVGPRYPALAAASPARKPCSSSSRPP